MFRLVIRTQIITKNMKFENQQIDESLNNESKLYKDKEIISTIDNIDEENNWEEKSEKEFQNAEKNFQGPLELVNKRYEDPNSTLSNAEQLKTYKEHNEEVLRLCIDRGIEKGFNEKELKMLEISAILHDLNKADRPEDKKAKIPNYTLVAHGEMAASEIKNILNDYPDILNEILGDNYTEEEKKETTSIIENTIRSHMGPHPGFMGVILETVNKQLKEMGEEEIEHPYPDNQIAETLLAVDMASLAGVKGREKVLAIRSVVPFFKKQDEDLCNEYKKYNINLTTGEAALLSGFNSAEQARDMLKNQEDKEWINQTLEDSKDNDYLYEEEKINYQTANAKRKKFEDAQKIKKLRKEIK
jgi:septum formation inhibitor MinC